MISVEEALSALFALVRPLQAEEVPLGRAHGRVLARDVVARRTQPPFAASAMDGYAVADGAARPGARFAVIGESAAGHRFAGSVGAGQAVRIFTGAPLPEGADRVIIQEDVDRDGDTIVLHDDLDAGSHVRPAGADFTAGTPMGAPRLLGPNDIALLAAMNVATLPVTRKPVVAIIATGDELVQPGEDPGPDQIIASNSHGLAALVAQHGAAPRLLPIARDNHDSLALAFRLAADADLIVTIGGASVGDHDLVGQTAQDFGLERAFHKIAMRPGKPLMMGRLHGKPFLGLPGNPVSAMVCGHLFLLPMLRALLGQRDVLPRIVTARLIRALPGNGPRAHYMRATLAEDATGRTVTAADRQDSALLTVLAQANALLIRPVGDPALPEGATVATIPL